MIGTKNKDVFKPFLKLIRFFFSQEFPFIGVIPVADTSPFYQFLDFGFFSADGHIFRFKHSPQCGRVGVHITCPNPTSK